MPHCKLKAETSRAGLAGGVEFGLLMAKRAHCFKKGIKSLPVCIQSKVSKVDLLVSIQSQFQRRYEAMQIKIDEIVEILPRLLKKRFSIIQSVEKANPGP